ncbi:MAG: hypothetical protein ACRESO_04580, partial [Gammaproteobacteria bacterium]
TALYTWLYPPAGWQAAIVFAVAAIIALPLAHLLRRRMQASRTNSALDDMDRGALVTVAEDTNGNLKVKYRDSLWEAVWEGTGKPQIGARAHKWWRVMARVCASGLWANKDIFIFQGEFPWVFPFQQSSVYSSSCGPWL